MAQSEVDVDQLRAAQHVGYAMVRAGADYLAVQPLGDGRGVYLLPMAFGNLRLAIGEIGSLSFDDVWCYQAEQSDAAWRAALGWDGEGEPEGWYRHPETGRRRPEGDATRELVYW